MTVGLYKTVQHRGKRVPLMTGYGNGVSIERIRFAVDREALTVDYTIVPGDEDHPQPAEQNLEELHQIREARRLTRSIEFSLPSAHGWDVQLTTKGSSEQVSQLPWTAHATRAGPSSPISETSSGDIPKFTFAVKHAELPNDHAVLKVRVVIELSASSALRLNGIPQPIEDLEPRDPAAYFISQQMFQDASSMAEQSLHTQSSIATMATSTSKASTIAERPQLVRTPTERSAAAEKSILSRVKRNYIYFSSLLQEPEAKWKQSALMFFFKNVRACLSDYICRCGGARSVRVATRFHRSYPGRISSGGDFRWDQSLGPLRCYHDARCENVLGQAV